MAFLSTNKQFKRLYPASLDDTATWDSYDDLVAYVESPTCYVNQIIGCEGKAYIIRLNEYGNKELHPLMDGEASKFGFHIGPTPPEDTSLIWIDTSDENIGTSFDDQVLNEFRAAYAFLQKQIDDLKASNDKLKSDNALLTKRVEELEKKVNSGWVPTGPTGSTGETGSTGPTGETGEVGDDFAFLLEDGSGYISLEDGDGFLVSEDGTVVTPTGPTGPTGEETINGAMYMEDGSGFLLTENDEYFIYE